MKEIEDKLAKGGELYHSSKLWRAADDLETAAACDDGDMIEAFALRAYAASLRDVAAWGLDD
jgi:hypothetical protein